MLADDGQHATADQLDAALPAADPLRGELEALWRLGPDAVRRRWRAQVGRPMPKGLGRGLTLRILAYHDQVQRHGGLDKASQRVLAAIAGPASNAGNGSGEEEGVESISPASGSATPKGDHASYPVVPCARSPDLLRPGTLLQREHGGVLHRVAVLANGFGWSGRSFDSLSQVAFAITGTRWNGPALLRPARKTGERHGRQAAHRATSVGQHQGATRGLPERRTMTASRPLRCAIYTRVSSDQGLEQDFNSLDAQREAAEAYVKSQAHEGWRLHRQHYDDGGFSGGSMERPALQALLADLALGRIDVVVVYKVDRLTRSLADFAKLVELFDAHGVSFVSVTQSFNTTSSMGRLTLNVLLSFAQFEREVTGERIRDKIAASKKKGIWMGGVVPLGYRVDSRKLHVDEAEAETVRLIFQRYIDLGSLPALQRDLLARAVRTRARVLSSGRTIGGVVLTNGPLSHMLKNRVYRGELNHKGQSYPSDHPAIVDAALFDAVQARLAANLSRSDLRKGKTGALLTGRIADAAGIPMSPSHTTKKGVRYRYYVSAAVVQGRSDQPIPVKRLPAHEVETMVMAALRDRLAAACVHEELNDAALVTALDLRISVRPGSLELTWTAQSLDAARGGSAGSRADAGLTSNADGSDGEHEPEHQRLVIPYAPQPHKRRRAVIMPCDASGPVEGLRREEQHNLLRALAQGRALLHEILRADTVDMAAIARRENRSERSIRATLSLAFVDPKLVRAAIHGTLPRGFGAKRLIDLPPHWPDQWQVLGLLSQG